MISKIKVLFFTTFLSLIVLGAQGQEEVQQDTMAKKETVMDEVAKLKWKKKLFIADDLWEGGSYLNAITVYEMVLEDKTDYRYTMNRL